MSGMSPFSTRFAARYLDQFPDDCRYNDGPARWFIQEVLWAAWLEVADELLGGPPLPEALSVGRERFIMPITPTDWAEFQGELGLTTPVACEHAGRLLAAQLLLAPVGPVQSNTPLNESLAILILLLCELDQRDRARIRGFEFDGDLTAVVRRHPTPAGFGPIESLPPTDCLADYAGLRATNRGGPLRTPFASVYRPLRQRMEGRRWTGKPAPPPELPAGFLRDAMKARLKPAEAPAEPAEVAAPQPLPPPPREAQIGLGELASLLGPVLLARNDPLEAARAAPPELGRRMCRALVEFLQGGGVEWYARPGDPVVLTLPHPDWQLDERAAPPWDASTAHPYRVTRWGLRLYGRVIAPARITPDLEGHR